VMVKAWFARLIAALGSLGENHFAILMSATLPPARVVRKPVAS
jgi:hypothetical protein